MGSMKIIVNIILRVVNVFVGFFSIKNNQVAFVSLEANKLESDLKLIYDKLSQDHSFVLKTVLINYNKKNLINNFLYLLNCIKQIYVINTSKVVLITDNNYVISNFKREGVKVIQIWHATGAIKKFGNAIKREYPIKNYDYVIANSEYWKVPYQDAFNVNKENVVVTGMPRVDHLVDQNYIEKTKLKLLNKYPLLKNKKVILYAPTFRGNIYQGMKSVDFDAKKLLDQLDDQYVLVYKLHPLLLDKPITDDQRIINLNHEDTHDLFTISDMLISDFSSIIFDYSFFNKPMYFFVPDLDEYLSTLGCFVDYQKIMPGAICLNENQLADAIIVNKQYDIEAFSKIFFKYHDGKNIERVVELIKKVRHE